MTVFGGGIDGRVGDRREAPTEGNDRGPNDWEAEQMNIGEKLDR